MHRCKLRTFRPDSTSPIPTSTPNGCRSTSSPRCAGSRRSGGTSRRKGNLAFGDDGYWVVTKHKDVKEVSRRSDVFSSNKKTALPRYRDEADPASLEAGKVVLLNQDAPHHTHLRKIMSRAFTPRAIESLRDELRDRAPRHRQGRRRRGIRRLRRAGVVRASAAGDRRSDGRAAGRPHEAVPLVEPDGRRPGP